MPAAAVRSIDLPIATVADEILVNAEISSVRRTARMPVSSLLKQLSKSIRVAADDFGAVGDGVADDKAAIEAAAATLTYGGFLDLSPSKIYYVSSLSLPDGVVLRGTLERPDFHQAGLASSLATTPGLALASSGTISLNDNAGIINCFVKRAGMTFPATSLAGFAGVAITFNGDDPIVRNVLVVGFAKGLAESPASVSRYVVEGFYVDAIDGCYIDKPSYDTSVMRDVHCWPFSFQPSVAYASMVRSGYALYLTGAQDNTIIDNYLGWGHLHNFHLEATSAIDMGSIWSDYPPSVSTAAQIGLYLGPNTNNIVIGNAQIWGGTKGIRQECNNTESIHIGLCSIVSTSGDAISSTGGELFLPNLKLQNIGGKGFAIVNNGSHVYARGYAINVAGTLVSLPVGAALGFIDIDLRTDPYYTPNGTELFGDNPLRGYGVTAAGTMALPANGDTFRVIGATTISTISGKWGERKIRLEFTGATTIVETGNINLAGSATFYTAANGDYMDLAYNEDVSKWVEIARGPTPALPAPPRGFLAGFTLSNNAVSPNTKIDVSAGSAANSTNARFLTGPAGTIDCATTGANGLDAGALANNTWYHAFVIQKADGTFSRLASTNLASPTLPSGYVDFRYVGSFRTNGSAQILAFTQIGDVFKWAAAVADVSTANMGVTNALYALTVPPGVKVQPIVDIGTTAGNILAFNGDETGYAPGAGNISVSPGHTAYGTTGQSAHVADLYTDTSRQIRVWADAANRPLYIYTRGYVNTRGRFD